MTATEAQTTHEAPTALEIQEARARDLADRAAAARALADGVLQQLVGLLRDDASEAKRRPVEDSLVHATVRAEAAQSAADQEAAAVDDLRSSIANNELAAQIAECDRLAAEAEAKYVRAFGLFATSMRAAMDAHGVMLAATNQERAAVNRRIRLDGSIEEVGRAEAAMRLTYIPMGSLGGSVARDTERLLDLVRPFEPSARLRALVSGD